MKIISSLKEIDKNFSVTIGNFDGLHVGHQTILKHMVDDSKKNGLELCVLTFKPHPQKILNPSSSRFLISSYEAKRKLLEKVGVSYIYEVEFDRDFSTQTPAEFVNNYLSKSEHFKRFYAGYDFAFGAGKSGSLETLKNQLDESVEIVEQSKFTKNGKKVSSTEVRGNISTGDFEVVTELLGRPFELEGIVVKGEGRGRKIGFPTANIKVDTDLIIPPNGVYITKVIIEGMTYNSITNVGFNPTFNDGQSINIESNLFDFDNFIYGETIRLFFYKKLRDEKKFSSVNDLVSQIKTDVTQAKEFHEKQPGINR
jgi:riboflavin kinase/FMN adenylyltransferase